MTGWFQVSKENITQLEQDYPQTSPELVIFATPLKGINLDIVGWD